MTQLERLERIRNRSTCYEIAAEIKGTRYLLGYRRLLSKSSLLTLAREYGDKIIELSNIRDGDLFEYRNRRWETPGTLWIGRTGRTERDAILTGELPHISTAN